MPKGFLVIGFWIFFLVLDYLSGMDRFGILK